MENIVVRFEIESYDQHNLQKNTTPMEGRVVHFDSSYAVIIGRDRKFYYININNLEHIS